MGIGAAIGEAITYDSTGHLISDGFKTVFVAAGR